MRARKIKREEERNTDRQTYRQADRQKNRKKKERERRRERKKSRTLFVPVTGEENGTRTSLFAALPLTSQFAIKIKPFSTIPVQEQSFTTKLSPDQKFNFSDSTDIFLSSRTSFLTNKLASTLLRYSFANSTPLEPFTLFIVPSLMVEVYNTLLFL